MEEVSLNPDRYRLQFSFDIVKFKVIIARS